MRRHLVTSLVMLLAATAVLGFGYPLAVTGLSQLFFQPRPSAAGAGYDASSSGATNLGPSNPLLIGFVPGVNIAGTNPFAPPADPACVPATPSGVPVAHPAPGRKYACDPSTIPERAIAYRQFNGLAASTSVPIDAVTASGSGLDPDISINNALDQASRVARFRHLAAARVIALVHRYTQGREWGFLGEPAVIARRSAGARQDPGLAGHHGTDVRRVPARRHRDRRRAHLLPDAHPRPDRRADRGVSGTVSYLSGFRMRAFGWRLRATLRPDLRGNVGL